MKSQFIDFCEIPFPEVNPIDLIVEQNGAPFKLANYRYPCKVGVERKGIVFYVHGYAEYTGRYGYLAREFSEAGFDFVGIDQRNFGNSTSNAATLGHFEGELVHQNDILAHIDLVDAKFGGPDVPKFIIGYSLGGLQTTQLALRRPDFFKGIGLLAPCYGFLEYLQPQFDALADKARAQTTEEIYELPNMITLPPRQSLHFMLDPLGQGIKMPAQNVLTLKDAPARLTTELIASVTSPVILVIGGNEGFVSNKRTVEMFNHLPTTDKSLVTVKGATHFPFHDKKNAQLVCDEIIRFFSRI
ncbi:hypothetical protein FGO68_gene14245 [Halteria grandinella]|uniref:Serine aminopeptidase S33 domain-containing protein n=1 Tax=Halteria grandinella TaxID=5974 RepID=A0A8J8T0J0_HALGN|nr:hypothetical protein FGO68_gene14245 [Halteria grandinella]